MSKRIIVLIVLFEMLCLSSSIFAQTTEGKDFWVTFMQADQDANNDLTQSLSFSAREDCMVTVSQPFTGWDTTLTVNANVLTQLQLYSGNVIGSTARSVQSQSGIVCYSVNSQIVDTCALHITSTSSISVFATSYKKATFDATNVIATTSLKDSYMMQMYSPSDHGMDNTSQGSHFAIIAAEDSVIVDYVPTVKTYAVRNAEERKAGGYILTHEDSIWLEWQLGDTLTTPMLMKGEVYYVWTGKEDWKAGDLSGTSVVARNGKKIAVFQGCPHTNIPYDVKERDHIFSQAMPTQYWGKTFVLTTSNGRNRDIFRIMALNDETEVYINGHLVHTFDFINGSEDDKKHFYEFDLGLLNCSTATRTKGSVDIYEGPSCLVETSDPCAVHEFLASKRYDGVADGDPAMLWVNPVEQQINQATFATYSSLNGTTVHNVNIVTTRPDSMYLDGALMPSSDFHPIAATKPGQETYYYAQKRLGSIAATHTLKNTSGSFTAHVYGFTSNESYGYSLGGTNFRTPYINYECSDNGVVEDFSTSADVAHLALYADGCSVPNVFTYNLGEQVMMEAKADGHHLTHWNDGDTDNPRAVVLTQDTTFTAFFAIDTITIATSVLHGKVIGGGQYLYGDTAHLFAQADPHYHFVRWTDGSTDNPHSLVVTKYNSIRPIFAIDRHTVSATALGGTVSGSGVYDYGTQVTLNVTVPENYQFIHWSDGDTDNPRSFILTQDTIFNATISKLCSGICGDSLTWNYSDGILVISGTGAMFDYAQGTAPWMLWYQDSITNIVINNGCTSIGNFAFYGLSNKNFKSLEIPNSVLSIGQFAFANCTYLKYLYLNAALETISTSAFANDLKLLYITCYAIEPPTMDESAFANYDAYLTVSCEVVDEYKVSLGWKKFNKTNISCIGAEDASTTEDDVTVEPTENDATFTWPANNYAGSYTLEIRKDGEVFCTLIFNSNGQLTGISFAPSRDGSKQISAAVQVVNAWKFTVTGLNASTQYTFKLDVLDVSEQSLKSYTGKFQTNGITDINQLVDSPTNQLNKVIKNNQLNILRDGKMYDATGVEVK